MPYELAIIGAGNMAEAIVRGCLAKQVLRAEQIVAADVAAQRREVFEKQLHVHAVESNAVAARDAKIALLSTKPQQMAEALAQMKEALSEQTLIVSIAAGISTRFIESHLGGRKQWRVIRTMPNTPMLIGEGVVAMAEGTHATREDVHAARRLFEAAAHVIEVTEDKLDAVTALSGSGPAYFFYLVEQMIAAGISLGLTEDEAGTLALYTASGAGKMLATSPDPPAELRRKVTSPGGTTQAAIDHLNARDWPTITQDAIRAACRRSRELGT